MKKTYLILGALFFGLIPTPIIATPTPVCDPTIALPPGPILEKQPDFSAWRIVYSFGKAESKPGSPASPGGGAQESAPSSHQPKTFTMTRTKPLWHAVLIDVSDVKNETWYDGATRFNQGAAPSSFVPITNGDSGGQGLKDYFSNGEEFPDVEWVSPATYLGVEKSTGYRVFQQSGGGAVLWVDSTTRHPVRWQKEGETRVFQFLPAPTDPLTLPPNVTKISRALKHLDEMSRAAPPHI